MDKIYYISMIGMMIVAWLSIVHGFYNSFILTALFLIVGALDNIANSIRNSKPKS